MHRFWIESDIIADDKIEIEGAVAFQIGRVLRLRPGSTVKVFDGSGNEWEVDLDFVGPKKVVGTITNHVSKIDNEPSFNLTLYQALVKGDKMGFILQKCTELGVNRFVPVLSERSIVRKTELSENKVERLENIVKEAAEQCGRSKLPIIDNVSDYWSCCKKIENGLLLWEEEANLSLKEEMRQSGRYKEDLSIMIGPEGGFSTAEIEHAKSNGIVTLSLGSRILRSETAAVTAVSIIMYEMGQLELVT